MLVALAIAENHTMNMERHKGKGSKILVPVTSVFSKFRGQPDLSRPLKQCRYAGNGISNIRYEQREKKEKKRKSRKWRLFPKVKDTIFLIFNRIDQSHYLRSKKWCTTRRR